MATSPQADFEALARQYWNAWGEAMRVAGSPGAMQAGAQSWHDGIDWWTRLAHGTRGEANAAVERFNTLAHDWYGRMQQVAAQFAGQDAGAAEIARAWKQALGAAGENPFPEMFRAMRGQGQQGLDQWIEDASPFLEAFKREGLSWLGLPAFGFAREHQERWQALAAAQLDYQDRSAAYNALMLKAAQRAYEVFEDRLAARAKQPDAKLKSARALFDLWIDAAEEAYAEIALSPEFREVYGKLVDAQMRVRAGVQKQVEQAAAQLGMPTRTEVDAAHRKIAELERQVRRLRDAVATISAGAPPSPASSVAGGSRPAPTSKPARGSNKRAGDPITGPRRGAAARPKQSKRQQKPSKAGATGPVIGSTAKDKSGNTAGGHKAGGHKAGKGKRA